MQKMKLFAKLLSLVIALTMLCGVAMGEEPQLAAAAQTEVDNDAYEAASTEIYNAVLGDFYSYYSEAKQEVNDLGLRYALMAISEAKILGSAVMIPIESRGGNYAITRIAPRSANTTRRPRNT